MVYETLRRLLARLPASCLLCEAPADAWGLCEPCLADLPWNHGACPRCALPPEDPPGPGARPTLRSVREGAALPVPARGPEGPALPCPPARSGSPPDGPGDGGESGCPGALPCPSCLALPPVQERTLAALRYEFPVSYLVSRLKYAGRLEHAPVLGELLAAAVSEHPGPLPDLILPVPLHTRRLGERGYNQALEIARPLARHTGLPLETRLLRRARATLPQMTLDRDARATNPAGAFAVDPERLAGLGPGCRIAVVDDVMTTGATLGEIARVLRAAGVAGVEYWVVARTPGSGS